MCGGVHKHVRVYACGIRKLNSRLTGIFIYIYRERETDRQTDRGTERGRGEENYTYMLRERQKER